MEKLKKIITDYLSSPETDYAIMINGEWGCGKTYFLDNGFVDLVGTITAPDGPLRKAKNEYRLKRGKLTKQQGERRYTPAYISLYGLSSAEDFYQRVFWGVNDWANHGWIRLIGTGLSKAIEVINIHTGSEDAKAVTYVDTNRVLVFDDLERICDDKISYKEVLGLINSYSEHDNRKVIIVCNETPILNASSDNSITSYAKFKEKSVRYTYHYSSDPIIVYNSLISKIDDTAYKTWIESNKDTIIELFDCGGQGNLRTLLFFIDTFRQVFNEVEGEEYERRILNTFMVTLLLYSMEYKGGVSIEKLLTLNSLNYYWGNTLSSFLRQDLKETKKEYCDVFRQKYAKYINSFRHNETLLHYITDGYLDVERLNENIYDLSTRFKGLEETRFGKVHQILKEPSLLDDKDVNPLILEMMSYVDQDKYSIYDLLNIYADLLMCGHWRFSGFSVTDDISSRVESSMRRQSDSFKYNPRIDVSIPVWDDSNGLSDEYNLFNQMRTLALSINNDARLREEGINAKAFLKAVADSDVKQLSLFRDKHASIISISQFDWKYLCDRLENSNNQVACELCECLMFLISVGNVRPEDLDAIKDGFKPWLDDYVARKDGRIRAMYISRLKEHIDSLMLQ